MTEKTPRNKNKLLLLLCLSLLLVLAALVLLLKPRPAAEKTAEAESAAAAAPSSVISDPGETAPSWLNSDLVGSVTADTVVSLKDDFHVYANKDWLSTAQIPAGQTYLDSLSCIEADVRENIVSMLTDATPTNEEAKLVQDFYLQCKDIETRNALGMSPVMPYIEDIRAIDSMDDLTAYLKRSDTIDPILYRAAMMSDFGDSSHYAIYLTGAITYTFGDADEYKSMTPLGERYQQANVPMLEKLLMRVDYTEQEAKTIVADMLALEGQFGSVAIGREAIKQPDYAQTIYNLVTIEELDQLSPVFPLAYLLEDYAQAGLDRFVLMDKPWLAKINELYTEENLDGFKAMLLCGTLREAAIYLDEPCVEILDEASSIINGMEIHSVIEEDAYTICSHYFTRPISRMYCENFVSPQAKEFVEKTVEEVVAVYKKRLADCTWLSKDTRDNAIEKLENLAVFAAYPDDWSDYSISDVSFAENATILDKVITMLQRTHRQDVEKSAKSIDKTTWSSSLQTVNAFYSAGDNSINILAGILSGELYDPDASIEKNLGGIGTVIGHEISHGFDVRGSQFDKDGNMISWWTEADRTSFLERANRISDYFDRIEVLPGMYCDGQNVVAEAMADIGGVSCILEIAEGIEGFDYDEFFTSYAHVWCQKRTKEAEERAILDDPHAPDYLRTNVTLQQFQEFYDTYHITEGDGMYLAPENRLSVW